MPQIVVGIGIQPDGTPVNLYTGVDPGAAQIAVDASGQAGDVNLGYIFENPPAVTTLRYAAAPVTAPAPAITALTPNTAPANADVTVAVTGTDFDPATVKVLVGTTELTPEPTPTATDLSVLVPAAEIAAAGTVQISVKNGDGQQSAGLDFTVT